MYRKIGMAVLTLVIFLSCGSYYLQASAPLKIIFNGKELMSDAAPQIIAGRTMVPLRVVAEKLGAEVSWDEQEQVINIKQNIPETADWHYVKLNGEATTWPYWIRDGKLYMEHRNAIQLVREGNRAPLHSVSFFPHSDTLYVDDLAYPLTLNKQGKYKIISIDYLRDLGVVNFKWDAATENIEIIYR